VVPEATPVQQQQGEKEEEERVHMLSMILDPTEFFSLFFAGETLLLVEGVIPPGISESFNTCFVVACVPRVRDIAHPLFEPASLSMRISLCTCLTSLRRHQQSGCPILGQT